MLLRSPAATLSSSLLLLVAFVAACTRDDVRFGAACDVDDDCDDDGFVCVDDTCVPAEVRDVLAGGEGEGEGEGGEGEGEGEGEASTALPRNAVCSVTNDRCDEGLRCVRVVANLDTGRCLLTCGTLDVESGAAVETNECPPGMACAAPTPLPELTPTLDTLVCVNVADENGSCLATSDVDTLRVNDDVCADAAQQCTVVARTADDTGVVRPSELACRTLCDTDDDCAAQPGTRCLAEDARTSGQDRTVCARPVRFAGSIDDLGNDTRCDTVVGIGNDPTPAACDPQAAAGVGSLALCVGIGGGAVPDTTGWCLLVCRSPAFDANGDGTIGTNEGAQEGSCPAEVPACSVAFGRALGVFYDHPDPDRVCDPANCTAGQPCPEECDVGDYECAEVGGVNRCVAFAGLCGVGP